MVIEFSCIIFFAVIFIYLAAVQLTSHLGLSQPNYKKQFLNLCIFLSILLIVSQTLFPIRTDIGFTKFEIYNLIPFKVLHYLYTNYSFTYFCYQAFGNIAMFVPLGYFLYLKTNSKKALLIAFLATLTVEFIQGFIPYRFCEIDDIWLNTLGACIGIIIAKTNIKVFNTKLELNIRSN